MAQLNDSIISGNLRVTGKTMSNVSSANSIEVYSDSTASAYGIGTNGQIIRSNGSLTHWDNEDISTIANRNTKYYATGNGLKQYSICSRTKGDEAGLPGAACTFDLDVFSSFTTTSGMGTSKAYSNTVYDFTKLYFYNSSTDIAYDQYTDSGTLLSSCDLVDLRYTLNLTTSTLTANKPVYLVFLATNEYEPSIGQIANAVNSNFPVYTQNIGQTLYDIHNNATLEAMIGRIRFVLIGMAIDGYRVDLLLQNTSYMTDPTIVTASKWCYLPVPTRSVTIKTQRAYGDEYGSNIRNTYASLSSLYHLPGTAYVIPANILSSGLIGNGGNFIYLSVPLPKMISPDVTSVTFTNFPINTRVATGYYAPSTFTTGGYDFIANDQGGGFTVSSFAGNTVTVLIDVRCYNIEVGTTLSGNAPIVAKFDSTCGVSFGGPV